MSTMAAMGLFTTVSMSISLNLRALTGLHVLHRAPVAVGIVLVWVCPICCICMPCAVLEPCLRPAGLQRMPTPVHSMLCNTVAV